MVERRIDCAGGKHGPANEDGAESATGKGHRGSELKGELSKGELLKPGGWEKVKRMEEKACVLVTLLA